MVNADLVGHGVLEPDGPAFDRVSARWPSVVIDGRIDRSRLAEIVFRDPEELAALEAITHPAIVAEIRARVASASGVVVVEAPVMLPLDDGFLRVFVDADETVRIGRAVARGGDEEDIRRRAANQADRGAWLAWADTVIDNDGSEEALREQVDTLWERFAAR